MIYRINICEKMITKYNQKGEDISGDEWSIPIENLTSSPFKGLTVSNIVNGLRELIYSEIKEEDVIAESGKLGIIGVIENGAGYQDPKGEYLCEYYFEVLPVGKAVDIERLFENRKEIAPRIVI